MATTGVIAPVIGEIRKGRDIEGCKHPSHRYIWLPCSKCGNPRWVQLIKNKPRKLLCLECAGLNRRKVRTINNAPPYIGEIRKGWEPYTLEFTDNLKEQIRQRDNYTCQLCGKPQGKKKLAIHHINYIKKDCRPKNLVSLCSGVKSEKCCHTLTNNNRAAWMAFFTEIMNKRFPSNEIQLIKTLVEGV